MRQLVLFGASRGRKVAEVLRVEKSLLEGAFRDREKKEEHETETESLDHSVYDHQRLPRNRSARKQYAQFHDDNCKIGNHKRENDK